MLHLTYTFHNSNSGELGYRYAQPSALKDNSKFGIKDTPRQTKPLVIASRSLLIPSSLQVKYKKHKKTGKPSSYNPQHNTSPHTILSKAPPLGLLGLEKTEPPSSPYSRPESATSLYSNPGFPASSSSFPPSSPAFPSSASLSPAAFPSSGSMSPGSVCRVGPEDQQPPINILKAVLTGSQEVRLNLA